MSNQDLQNKIEDEILSVEDGKIRQMIKSLRKVNAPKDFDFRLKARIANARASDFQPRFLPALRYVLPLSVVVLIFAFVVLNSVYFVDNQAVPQVAETAPQTPVERQTTPADNFPIMPDLAANNTQTASNKNFAVDVSSPPKNNKTLISDQAKLVAGKSPKKPQAETLKEKIIDEGGGSRVSAVSPPIIITPKGIPSNDTVKISPKVENANFKIAEQILLPLGIETISENGKLQVKAVKQNSVAERSSVKVGDIIEAIDGEKLTEQPLRAKTIKERQITVVRDTQRIKISLPKQ
ncbi:hypothetical protein BH24ACI2_BH24ACI2_10590 [soil metagenome]|nr:hypothetical protein [Acidobacteriota bacterium]